MTETKNWPKCRKLDRLVCEADEEAMTEFIRCTRCRRKSPVVPISAVACQPEPNALAGWNALPRSYQPFLSD
jgi:hypothetical protein